MIKAIITDFDGTLVNTFKANYQAYARAFHEVGLELSPQQYGQCFGLRFDRFMDTMNIKPTEIRDKIRKLKKDFYPLFFDSLRPNLGLIALLRLIKSDYDVKIAIASTARRENLLAVLNYLDLNNLFDLIMTGESVVNGKPDPEIYIETMNKLNVASVQTLIFEDSEIGIAAAKASGANYIKISSEWK